MVKLFWIYIFFLASPPDDKQKEPTDKHIIYVSSISWHTGIVVPGYTLPDSLWSEDPNYAATSYLEIGWGDADFFTHEGFNLWYAFKAVFWPTPSVLHVNPIHGRIEDHYFDTDVVGIALNDEQLHRLSKYLVAEFELDKNGKIIPVAEGIYPKSNFYKGSSSYYFPNNSNVWAARAVKRAGFSIAPIWHQTTGSVLNKVVNFGDLVVESN